MATCEAEIHARRKYGYVECYPPSDFLEHLLLASVGLTGCCIVHRHGAGEQMKKKGMPHQSWRYATYRVDHSGNEHKFAAQSWNQRCDCHEMVLHILHFCKYPHLHEDFFCANILSGLEINSGY